MQWLDPDDRLKWSDKEELSNIGIVDDDAYLCICEAEVVQASLSRIAQVNFEEYKSSGLELHLHAAKTACLVTWKGEGCKQARRDFDATVAAHGGIPFKAYGVQMALPTAVTYKHVGCWSRADTAQCTEVDV